MIPADTLSIALDYLVPAKYGSPEHHAKIGAANKGRVFTPKHRANLGASHKGKFHGRPAMTPEEKILANRAAVKRHSATEHGKTARRARDKRNKKWLKESERDRSRRRQAKKMGYAAPPRERDCPPRPLSGAPCQCCGDPTIRFHLDHNHVTGAFRGWTCSGCNTGHGLPDNPRKLAARLKFIGGL